MRLHERLRAAGRNSGATPCWPPSLRAGIAAAAVVAGSLLLALRMSAADQAAPAHVFQALRAPAPAAQPAEASAPAQPPASPLAASPPHSPPPATAAAPATLRARVVPADENWSTPLPGAQSGACASAVVAVFGDAADADAAAAAAADFAARHAASPPTYLASAHTAGALGSVRNAAYAAAVALRACAVWDAGAGVRLTGRAGELAEAAAAALSPLAAPSPVYLGVRPRSANLAVGEWGALTNPLSALAPSAYAWPRGYPAARGEAERGGAGAGTAELVRLAAGAGGILAENVAVLQPALMGAADTEGGGGDASYHGTLPLVLLAPGAVAPYGAVATLVRERGLWSLFTPPSKPAHSADIWRAYIAQAVFALCGLHVGFVPAAWATRAASTTTSAPSGGPNDASMEALLTALASWVAKRGPACRSGDGSGCHAAALLEDVYLHLRGEQLVTDADVSAVQAWLLALRSSGYAFPAAAGAAAPPMLLSPARPPSLDAIDVHVAVHINWARDTAAAAVPLWHAVHAAQYRSVSYHLDFSGQDGGGAMPSTFFSALAAPVVPPAGAPAAHAGWPSGYFAYEAFLGLWADDNSVAARAAALLWTHDDLVVNAGIVAAWLRRTHGTPARCVVIMDSPGDSELLPPLASWPAGNWWLPRLAGEGAAMVAAAVPCAARGGAPLTDGELWKGYSDAFAARRGCAGADAFAAALAALRRAGAFLEIAVHTAANCAESNGDLGKWREFSLWTERRGDPFAYLEASRGDAPPPVMHPLKLSDAVAVAVTVELRDDAWAAVWKQRSGASASS